MSFDSVGAGFESQVLLCRIISFVIRPIFYVIFAPAPPPPRPAPARPANPAPAARAAASAGSGRAKLPLHATRPGTPAHMHGRRHGQLPPGPQPPRPTAPMRSPAPSRPTSGSKAGYLASHLV